MLVPLREEDVILMEGGMKSGVAAGTDGIE
jgi:hypothetical protein